MLLLSNYSTIFSNSTAEWGTILYIKESNLELTNIIVEKSSVLYGGGIAVLSNSSLTLKNSICRINTSSNFGVAFYIFNKSSLNLNSVLF